MPQKFHNPPTPPITHLRLQNPIPKPLIIALRPLQHPLPAHRKLRAARLPNSEWHIWLSPLSDRRSSIHLRRRPREDIHIHVWRDVFVLRVRLQAAGVQVAAEVHVAVLRDEIELEHS